ncbi:MAG: hypothetical protein WEB37_02625 [Bacteroidota bacterium]
MKSLRFSAIIACLLVVPSFLASQVRSDYEATQAFEREADAIARAVTDANTVVECVDIESRIMELDSTYREYKDLLDRALYPDGFEGRLAKLTGQITYAKGKIMIIETQYDRISELEAQVRELSSQVEQLSGQNTKMLDEVKRLSSSRLLIDSLNAVIITLRKGLRDRDNLIFALVDSLFLQYDKDVTAMSDQEKRGVAARLERRNVFSGIKQSIDDNIRFLESTTLSGNDLTKLMDEQAAFASKWNGLGKKLAEVYLSTKSKRTAELATIDTMLILWKSTLGIFFWKSLNDVFVRNATPIQPFSTPSEFQTNINLYLDEEIRKARDDKDGQRYFRYQSFADSVWYGNVEPNWIPSMVKTGSLTEAQVDEIEDKVDEWKEVVSPPLTMVYVIIALVMLIVVLYLYRRYSKTRQGSVDSGGGATAGKV